MLESVTKFYLKDPLNLKNRKIVFFIVYIMSNRMSRGCSVSEEQFSGFAEVKVKKFNWLLNLVFLNLTVSMSKY